MKNTDTIVYKIHRQYCNISSDLVNRRQASSVYINATTENDCDKVYRSIKQIL